MPNAEGKFAIAIPVYDKVDMLDVAGPYEMFSWAGFDIDLLAAETGMLQFRGGFRFEVTTDFAHAGTYDALWVPGGDPDALADIMGDKCRTYLDFLIDQAGKIPLVASVCEGALLLAAAGLLDGYEATTHWRFIPCLLERFPKVKVAPGYPRFCLDRDRLTGGGISSGLDEALKLIEMLAGRETAESAQQTTQYYPDPPVWSELPHIPGCPVRAVTIPPRKA
jgi:cyclohexyl-isocyanide hydratase